MSDAPTIERHVLWQADSEPGLEYFHLIQDHAGVQADGWGIGVRNAAPFHFQYQVRCDPGWHVRRVDVRLVSPPQRALILSTDETGPWTDGDGEALPFLAGCSDVDISVTPFTNTLPIRRLPWQPGVSADLLIAYISVPELRVEPVRQRYTCLAVTPEGGHFRYEDRDLFPGFTAEIMVDVDGLVLDYPGLFHRLWSH